MNDLSRTDLEALYALEHRATYDSLIFVTLSGVIFGVMLWI